MIPAGRQDLEQTMQNKKPSRSLNGSFGFSRWQLRRNRIRHLSGDGFVVSYNPSTKQTFNAYRKANSDSRYDSESDTEETALYITSTDVYLILNGDFRKEYERCTTVYECLSVYRKYSPAFRSKWSMEKNLN